MSEPKEFFEDLACRLNAHAFDVMLVGDGAGSFIHTPCGWYVTLYERETGQVWEHQGGASGGTNNYAELEPFVHALTSYRHVLWAYHTKKFGQQPKEIVAPRVLIVSDSEVTVRCGNGEYTRRANAPLWASIEWFERKGYKFQWIHVPRNSNAANKKADEVAKKVRALLSNA